jgi:hypothetical protein
MLFEFTSFNDWVIMAPHRFKRAGVRGDQCICVDSVGRLCRIGKQFHRARKEGTFPIRVYRQETES